MSKLEENGILMTVTFVLQWTWTGKNTLFDCVFASMVFDKLG